MLNGTIDYFGFDAWLKVGEKSGVLSAIYGIQNKAYYACINVPWQSLPHFAAEKETFTSGGTIYYVWQYEAATGNINVYAGTSLENVHLVGALSAYGFDANANSLEFGFGDGFWEATVSCTLKIAVNCGDTLDEVLAAFKEE